VDGNNERLLTPGEVAALFRVDPKTVTRWAASGRITSIRTPGGHRRFRESEVRALLRGDTEVAPEGHPALLPSRRIASPARTPAAKARPGLPLTRSGGKRILVDEPGELLEFPQQRGVASAPLPLALLDLIGSQRTGGEPRVVRVVRPDLDVDIADDPPVPGVDGGLRDLEVTVR
jgi:excisionase family DNA binding protein